MLESVEEKYSARLKKYLPEHFITEVVKLLINHPVKFKIVKPRKRKLGDFKAGLAGKKHQITINGNLNPYSFLITTIHEFAHLITYNEYGARIDAHGKEWKKCYSKLILPIVNSKQLPEDIEAALTNSLIKVKASSCSDINLFRVLTTYDPKDGDNMPLEALEKNSTFVLNGKRFIKGKLRRTRFICVEENSKRQFLVNAMAQVKEIKDGK